MLVAFVHTPIPGAPFNSSIAALSASLREAGHDTALLTVPWDSRPGAAVAVLEAQRPDVIAWSFMTCRASAVAELTHRVRAALPRVRMIAGGAHPTSYPADTLAALDVDAIGVGEGEQPLLDWLADPDQRHVGIVRRGHDDPVERWWAPDPNDLPDWDRALFGDVRNAGNRYEQAVGVALARGFCPYVCSFCGVDAYRRINAPPGKPMRLRTVDRVLDEIDRARHIVPAPDGFASWDEVLPSSRAWLDAFMHGYRDRIGLPFACHLRVEQVTPALVDALVAGGCDYVVIGVECGDEGYRRGVLRKPFTNKVCKEAFARLHAAGIGTFASFMIGMPHETPRQLAATVRFARALDPTELSWKFYTPERGTALFDLVTRDDLVIPEYVDHPFGAGEPMIRLTRCTRSDVARAERALELIRRDGPRGTFEQARGTPIALSWRAA